MTKIKNGAVEQETVRYFASCGKTNIITSPEVGKVQWCQVIDTWGTLLLSTLQIKRTTFWNKKLIFYEITVQVERYTKYPDMHEC